MLYDLAVAYSKSMNLMTALIATFSEISTIGDAIFTTGCVAIELHCSIGVIQFCQPINL